MWETGISKIEPNHIVTRGFRQEELIGNVPFASVFFLLIKSRMPDKQEAQMVDALITSSVDHGVTPPSTHAARLVASAGVALPSAVAAGVLAIGDVHGGAIEDAARLLQEWNARAQKNKWNSEQTARELLEHLREKGARMPGFGHRIHTRDPRTRRLFDVAAANGFKREHINLALAIEREFARNKPLPINVDGAIAAIISDMDFDWRLGKAFFLIGRVAGMIAHVYEEMTSHKPMRRMCNQETEYSGPWERSLE
ncbi:citryl-CoA lyase [candidate division WOR-3 bacterium]|nr:citryl-CoA lyase [candidate division WOR-3 bacterium]